jgi:hypothetical protein
MDPAAEAAFEAARLQMDPKEVGDELLAAGESMDPAAVQQFKAEIEALNLPPEVLDALGQVVDAILAEPGNYPEIRAEFIAEGVPEDFLPEEFDAIFFGALNMALDQINAKMASMPAPQAFADGGIVQLNPVAAGIAKMGRNGDTMLAHVTPSERRMLRRRGGSGTINPATGLPEFFFKAIAKAVGGIFKGIGKAVKGVFKGIKNIVKKFVSNPIGRLIATAALAFFVGPAAASMMGVTSTAGVAAVSGFVGNFGTSVLSGQKIGDALKSGALGALTAGATAGIMGGSQAFASGSYTGPTTVSGQFDAFKDKLSGFITGPQQAPAPISTATPLDPAIGKTMGLEAPAATAPAPAAPPPAQSFPVSGMGGGTGITAGTTQGITAPTGTDYSLLGGQPSSNVYAGAPTAAGSTAASTLPKSEGIFSDWANAAKSIYNNEYGTGIDYAQRAAFGTPARMVGTGLAGLYLSGGFNQEQVSPPDAANQPTGTELLRQNPEMYGTAPGGAQTVFASADPYANQPYNFRAPVFQLTPPQYPVLQQPTYAANGGIMALRDGGTPEYPRRVGQISGPGTEKSDSIPAMLSDGEFVLTAKAVRGAGNGSRREGAKKMYQMMRKLERMA